MIPTDALINHNLDPIMIKDAISFVVNSGKFDVSRDLLIEIQTRCTMSKPDVLLWLGNRLIGRCLTGSLLAIGINKAKITNAHQLSLCRFFVDRINAGILAQLHWALDFVEASRVRTHGGAIDLDISDSESSDQFSEIASVGNDLDDYVQSQFLAHGNDASFDDDELRSALCSVLQKSHDKKWGFPR
eukprot:763305_1